MNVWGWPVLYGAASAAGLLAALLGDGWLDVVSWVALGASLIPLTRGLRVVRATRRRAVGFVNVPPTCDRREGR